MKLMFNSLFLKILDWYPSPTRTDMNRSSTDFESVTLGLKPFITLSFLNSVNVWCQWFFKISMNVKALLKILVIA